MHISNHAYTYFRLAHSSDQPLYSVPEMAGLKYLGQKDGIREVNFRRSGQDFKWVLGLCACVFMEERKYVRVLSRGLMSTSRSMCAF